MTKKVTHEKRPPIISRLQAGITASDEYLKPMLACRNRMLAQYANSWYSGGVGAVSQPINLIDQVVSIICSLLIGGNSRGAVKAKRGVNNPNAKMFAQSLQLALDDLCGEIKLSQNTLRPIVRDSLFGMGISVAGVMKSHTVELGGYLHDYGQPYCDAVDFADYIVDRHARNRQEMHYEGYRYRLPIQYVAESGLFKNYDQLVPNLRLYGQKARPEEISKGDKMDKSGEEVFPSVELVNLWLPDAGMIVTLPPEGQGTKYLREVEWDGPEDGPMNILGYKFFPNTVIPIPPVYLWLSIHKTVNLMVNKMRDLCAREKTIAVGDLSNPTDKQLIKDSEHGDFLLLQGGADNVKEITFGGFNPQSMPFLQFMLGMFSQIGPNLKAVGGRGVMAETVGQEQMLQARAMQEIEDMTQQVYNFTRSIMKKLAHFLVTDPVRVRNFQQDVEGIPYELTYHSSKIEGILDDYDIDIEPYSLGRMNPEIRYQRIMQLLSQVVIPLAPLAMQQGSYPSVDAIVKELGEYLNVDTDVWWRSATPDMTNLGANQPLQGSATSKTGQNNQGDLGRAESSRLSDLQQYMSRTGGAKSSAE